MILSYSSGMKFTAVIQKDEEMYVAKCPEVSVVSQGRTVNSALKNLKEAVELYIEEMGMPKGFKDGEVFIANFTLTKRNS